MNQAAPASTRPRSQDEAYRLYIDESGDHVCKRLEEPSHRYLCLLGCWFKGADYRLFHADLESLKQRHLPHNPDDPLILHRDDLINRRGPFGVLREAGRAAAFDADLLQLVEQAHFRIVAVVIDKLRLTQDYPTPAHPYHLAMGFMLQRYCGYLNHISRCGDVMAESRGGVEDRLLKDSYERTYERGAWQRHAEFFQEALTSRQLKVKPKQANVAGLQLADVLGHPIKQSVLAGAGHIPGPLAPFAQQLVAVCQDKLNRHLYNGRTEGYGTVLFPK
jgi:hypothetical protein